MPSVDPSVMPTSGPTDEPSTISPTTTPTEIPTLYITAGPTAAPTFCLDASYKGIMTLSEGGALWNNQVFASPNCGCKLVHSADGNLILYESVDSQWLSGWETNTSMFDYSGEAVSKLEWDNSSRTMVLNEYIYRDTAIQPIELWTLNVTLGETEGATLVLSNECCLKLVDSVDYAVVHWEVCAETELPTAGLTGDVVMST